MEVTTQPEGCVSVTVYPLVGNTAMPVKAFVFVTEIELHVPGVPAPSTSMSEKLESGEGLPVKSKQVGLFGTASFTIVMEPGKITAPAERLRSWAPTLDP